MAGSAQTGFQGRSDDFVEGRIRACRIGDETLVATRLGGRVCAVAGTCPHRGAPLAEGVLDGRRLICPWHHATFDITSGELLDAPALDSLRRYVVAESDGTVSISEAPEALEPLKPSVSRRVSVNRGAGVVVVGGGAAGVAAAGVLRERGYEARITLLSADNRPPYDRTELSKLYLAGESGPDTLPLRSDGFYHDHEIDVRLRTLVVGVDPQSSLITLAEGEELAYQSLLIATGSQPRTLPVPGSELPGVSIFRSLDDCEQLAASVRPGMPVVVVGSSFIGMEVAAALCQRQCRVTVVSKEGRPYEGFLGPTMSDFFRRRHEEQGVRFRWHSQIERVQGKDAVEAVMLQDGSRVEAAVVVIGLGVRPQVPPINGMPTSEDGSLDTDATMRVAPHIWAAGDIARFPSREGGRRFRIEHWRVAEQQGRTAARSILGGHPTFDAVPFFWTLQLGVSMRYVGWPTPWERETVLGEPESGRFLCLYSQGDQVVGAAASERDSDLAAIEVLLGQGGIPPASALAGDNVDLVGLLDSSRRSISRQ